ncbi:MAG: terminase large subunit [Limnohabitans sp.]
MADSPAMAYAEAVLSGEVLACKWVRLAVERHMRDLETGHERGIYFDENAAWHIIDFFQFTRHLKGEWAGRPIELEEWQQFFLWMAFGWMRTDGTRRFRFAYLEIARKNGKTTTAAGVGLYLAFADGEMGAEVYACATKKDQAKICHGAAANMVKMSPDLGDRLDVLNNNISDPQTLSKFEPLGRDSNSTDGLNPSGAVMDELHAWKNRDLWDVIETGTGSRTQPMIIAITTAGYNRHSICWEKHEYLCKILTRVIDDDSFFGMIYTLDDEDEFDDERNWIKANPNIGVSVKLDDLRDAIKRAKESPASMNSVLRLRLNKWTQAETRWLNIDKWRKCGSTIEPSSLRGRRCYGGLDLSSSIDITAFILVFPPVESGEPYKMLCRFFIPEDNMRIRSKRDRVPYEVWCKAGLITATPGNVIDYAWIIDQIKKDAEDFDLQEIAFDRWGATLIYQQLNDLGLQVVEFGQGFASMSPPAKEMEKMVLAEEICHGDNPVLAWMADNVVVIQDPAGNIKPAKDRSLEKIDGIVAGIMALDRALHGETNSKVSRYEREGIRSL